MHSTRFRIGAGPLEGRSGFVAMFSLERDHESILEPSPTDFGFSVGVQRDGTAADQASKLPGPSVELSRVVSTPRYQIFVSSTYRDLEEERARVSQILLQLDCIPSGMELFPAADEDQLQFIKKVIDDCDYYLLIVAGRYGSVDSEGISYTEREFDYAVSRGLKVIALLHEDPGSIDAANTEPEKKGRRRLDAFREKARTARLVKTWKTPADLAAQVSVAISWVTKTYPATGWVRANQLADVSAKEVLALRERVQELESQILELEQKAPAGSEALAQGDDPVDLSADVVVIRPIERAASRGGGLGDIASLLGPTEKRETLQVPCRLTWNEVFAALAPAMMDEASEHALTRKLHEVLGRRLQLQLQNDYPKATFEVKTSSGEYEKVLVQFKALGLVAKSPKKHTASDPFAYWSLTPRGDSLMTALVAAKRPDN
jgi:hypothetical protein